MTRLFPYFFLPESERWQTLKTMSSLLDGVTENNVRVKRDTEAERGNCSPIIRFSSITPTNTMQLTADELTYISAVQRRAMCRSLMSHVPVTAPLIPDFMT